MGSANTNTDLFSQLIFFADIDILAPTYRPPIPIFSFGRYLADNWYFGQYVPNVNKELLTGMVPVNNSVQNVIKTFIIILDLINLTKLIT